MKEEIEAVAANYCICSDYYAYNTKMLNINLGKADKQAGRKDFKLVHTTLFLTSSYVHHNQPKERKAHPPGRMAIM